LLGIVSLNRLQQYAAIAERQPMEETFKASLRQQEVLLREVHHRVKNNLQIISSLLSLQASYIQDPLISAMFTDTQYRIISMALVHETLYQASNQGMIDLGAYVRTLVDQIWRSYSVQTDRITLKIQADDVLLDINQAIPCGLILNELLSNCLKHAFPSGSRGEIHIELRSDAVRQVNIIVPDTGVGFPAGMDFRDPAGKNMLTARCVCGMHRLVSQVPFLCPDDTGRLPMNRRFILARFVWRPQLPTRV
jgi:two-component sensor histidine kinase